MVKNNSLGDLSSERGQVHLQFPSYHPSVIMGSTHEDLIFTEMSLFTYIYIYIGKTFQTDRHSILYSRNIGMGSCAFWTRVGGVIAPQIVNLVSG